MPPPGYAPPGYAPYFPPHLAAHHFAGGGGNELASPLRELSPQIFSPQRMPSPWHLPAEPHPAYPPSAAAGSAAASSSPRVGGGGAGGGAGGGGAGCIWADLPLSPAGIPPPTSPAVYVVDAVV